MIILFTSYTSCHWSFCTALISFYWFSYSPITSQYNWKGWYHRWRTAFEGCIISNVVDCVSSMRVLEINPPLQLRIRQQHYQLFIDTYDVNSVKYPLAIFGRLQIIRSGCLSRVKYFSHPIILNKNSPCASRPLWQCWISGSLRGVRGIKIETVIVGYCECPPHETDSF